jgi:sulfatase maturation enzyme AslB (radical SAM superfamily)
MKNTSAPSIELAHLDQLWFQVAGTLCNLTCHHCFISCSPHNRSFGFLTFAEVRDWLERSVPLGVKEYYFTGGEPFLNRELVPMLAETLRYGPTTVLTNATVLKPEWLSELSAAEKQSAYSLEFRVSIDGFSPEMNDPIRGEGTFVRALQGLKLLVEYNFLPIITIARTWPDADEQQMISGFIKVLQRAGYTRPRLKILPTIKLGAEVSRTNGYEPDERVTAEMLVGFDRSQLLCHHSRLVTDRGVWVCPILLDSPEARLGATLADAQRPFALSHGACFTCYQYGAICSNPSGHSGSSTSVSERRRLRSQSS